MTSENSPVYVWAWLPGATEPVVAGALTRWGNAYFFNYGKSYLGRSDAIPLYLPELPLRSGRIPPRGALEVAGVILDAAPDGWGQRVVLQRLASRNEGTALGNTDDHARNHAAFWDGAELSLTPAYDICPYPRAGGEATQAMAIDREGNSLSRLALCVDAAPIYGLSPAEARGVIDFQIEAIESEWEDAADRNRLATADRAVLWKRAILNPFVFEGYR